MASRLSISTVMLAREALDFGLSVVGPGFNVFVFGDGRSRRMTASLAYLDEAIAKRAPPNDWVYLNNFRYPDHPTPHDLPVGIGRHFRDAVLRLIPQLQEALSASFAADPIKSSARRRVVGEGAETRRDGCRQFDKSGRGSWFAGGARQRRGLRLLPKEETASESLVQIDAQTERDTAPVLSRVQLSSVNTNAKLAA